MINPLYSITTSEAEIKKIEDAFVFQVFGVCVFFEPFTNGLSIKFLQLLVVDIENSKFICCINV